MTLSRSFARSLYISLFLVATLLGLLRSTVAEAHEQPPVWGGATAHLVLPDETVEQIAAEYGVTPLALSRANSFTTGTTIRPGFLLLIPASRPAIPAAESVQSQPAVVARGTITERMTVHARQAPETSPFFGKTWLTYYGRPNVEVMGILGEFDVDQLTTLLQEQAASYDQANGPELDVLPAFHLVHGMATKAPGDGSHLTFLPEETVQTYIDKAKQEGFAVILDVQIGTLSPARSISDVLPYLQNENVHLAIDPEFAVVHPGQRVPGNPIGFVTAEQVNEVQETIAVYLEKNNLPGPRVLLVHQFQDSMIVNKQDLDWNVPQVALVLSVDGWGPPWGKISKFQVLTDGDMGFLSFKLFYRWDDPLMTEAQALGEEPFEGAGYIDITPNMIIYQ